MANAGCNPLPPLSVYLRTANQFVLVWLRRAGM